MILDIINEKGLHARASAKFVELVETFDAEVEVSRNDLRVSGDSIMGLLMLGAAQGTQIELHATGPQANALLDALKKLVGDYFDEGK